LKLLLDEMYSDALAGALADVGIEATMVRAAALAGRSDYDVFLHAVDEGRTLLTENVGDFAGIAAEHSAAGRRHPGVLIALSSRFSRRPEGRQAIVRAISATSGTAIDDLVVYFPAPDPLD
jgi:hypothetical protein